MDQITVTGNDCSSCGYQSYQWNFSGAGGLAGYVIQSGDKVGWRQGQTASAYDGLNMVFTDGSQTAGVVFDQSGQDMASGTDGYRTADLSGEAGKTISQFQLSMNNQGSLAGGLMFVVYGDIVLYSRDGTVRPVYTEELSASLSGSGTSGITGVTSTIGHINNSYNPPIVSFPQSTTVYYHGDQIGSARLMTDGQGNPIWSGVFLPFGQEWNAQATMNHYKFTGKERDAETNLDYFGARYDSSSMGRFMSPDPENAGASAIDPQSWNAYAYVDNNPLNATDPTGTILQLAGDNDQAIEADESALRDMAGSFSGDLDFSLAPSVGFNPAAWEMDKLTPGARQIYNWVHSPNLFVFSAKPLGQNRFQTQVVNLTRRAAELKLAADAALFASIWFPEERGDAIEAEVAAEEAEATVEAATEAAAEGSTGGDTAGKRFSAADRAKDAGKPCSYCGRETTEEAGKANSRETDHIHPRAKGGNTEPENRAPSCRTCNRAKGARTPLEWRSLFTNKA